MQGSCSCSFVLLQFIFILKTESYTILIASSTLPASCRAVYVLDQTEKGITNVSHIIMYIPYFYYIINPVISFWIVDIDIKVLSKHVKKYGLLVSQQMWPDLGKPPFTHKDKYWIPLCNGKQALVTIATSLSFHTWYILMCILIQFIYSTFGSRNKQNN